MFVPSFCQGLCFRGWTTGPARGKGQLKEQMGPTAAHSGRFGAQEHVAVLCWVRDESLLQTPYSLAAQTLFLCSLTDGLVFLPLTLSHRKSFSKLR
jgi:hypothetical protein